MEIESIKQKVLEDVDPVMKKKKAKERRKQRLIVIMQFLLVFVVVLGDNREVSRDSREIGTVKIKNIKGKIRWSIGIF